MEAADRATMELVERRGEPRLNIGNQVVGLDLGGGLDAISCCVWDISRSGACLMIPPDMCIPHTLRVFLEGGPRTAEVVWRMWSHVGIKFAD